MNQLLISENTGAFKETGKAIISLDVLQKGVEDYFFLGSFSAFREKNSMDVTGKHDDRIRAILKDCLMQFSNLDWKNIKPIAVSTYLPKTPKLMVEHPGIGFFKSFTELYKNITFTDSSITFKDNKHRPQKLFLDDRIHKRALYYAYSNGENVFINASNYSGEKHFVKTKQFKNYLLFNDSFIQQGKASGASMAFGVLGLLASEQRVHVLLDLFSGQYHVLDRRTITNLLNKIEYKDLYKLYRQKPYNIEVMYSILETLSNEMGDEKLKQKFQI
ncbi:hypothetical protein [Seonamhaeicola sp. ML3]|uniref:hypothetical protein n=1 Tax=Seonamhaeicola sp. ML3 TaxID=2937786 RepID=UPI00200F17F4|nr:hypothetical protein [Seonamhaeicola sp. ML3]